MQIRHGMSNYPEYHLWNQMKYRCSDQADKYYGGRGIIVCDRWMTDFSIFIADMGRRPSKNHSVDRIDNDGNYEPGNCRWATRYQQTINTRRLRSNASGLRGVNWNNQKERWTVQINANGKRIYLGASKDFFEACCLRIAGENKYWTELNE